MLTTVISSVAHSHVQETCWFLFGRIIHMNNTRSFRIFILLISVIMLSFYFDQGIAFRESIHVIRRGLFSKQSATKSGNIFKLTDRLRKKANLVQGSVLIPSLSSSINVQNNQKPLHRSFSTKSVTDEPVQSPPTTTDTTPLNAPSQAIRVYNKTVTKTGSFAHNWPTVHEPIIHYKRAYRATQNLVHADMKNKNERNRQRKYTAQFIDTLMKQLSVPITHLLELYTKELKNLHPYEQTVANLTMIARGKKGLPELPVSVLYL